MRIALFLFACCIAMPVMAGDIDRLDQLSPQQFDDLAGDLSGVLAYRGVQPAEPYGVVGFELGVDLAGVRLSHENAWNVATGSSSSTLPLTRVGVTKGLPFGFDVGGFLAKAPGSNVSIYGAQLRYALVEGDVVTPAVGLRAAATRMNGVDQLDGSTRSLDLSVSKGMGPMTPYLGYGRVWSSFDPAAGTGLQSVDRSDDRLFAGLRFTLVALQFTLEADRTADATAYSLKLGFGF